MLEILFRQVFIAYIRDVRRILEHRIGSRSGIQTTDFENSEIDRAEPIKEVIRNMAANNKAGSVSL